MSDPTIPAEAIQAALDALEAEDGNRTYFTFPEMARIAVEAAAPFLAEHIAQRIEAQCGAYSHEPEEIRRCRIHNGARLAREVFPKETT